MSTTTCNICHTPAIIDVDVPSPWQANILALRTHRDNLSHSHWHAARAHIADGIRRVAGHLWANRSDRRLADVVEELIDGRGHYETDEDGEDVWVTDRKGLTVFWTHGAAEVLDPVRVVRASLKNARLAAKRKDGRVASAPLDTDSAVARAHEARIERAAAERAQNHAEPDDYATLPALVARRLVEASDLVTALIELQGVRPLESRRWAWVISEAEQEDNKRRGRVFVEAELTRWATRWSDLGKSTFAQASRGEARPRWTHGADAPRTDTAARAWQARYHADEDHEAWTSPDEIPVGAKTSAKRSYDKHLSEFWKAWRRANRAATLAVREFDDMRCDPARRDNVPKLREWSAPAHPTLTPTREKSGGGAKPKSARVGGRSGQVGAQSSSAGSEAAAPFVPP